MKTLSKILFVVLLLAPFSAFATISATFNATSTDKGSISPTVINGNSPSVLIQGKQLVVGSTTLPFGCPASTCGYINGSDNTTNGVQLFVGNTLAGPSSYAGINLENDKGNSNLTNFSGAFFNSSAYSDATFGTGVNNPSQLVIQNTLANLSLVTSSTTSSNAFINFLTGGAAASNERMRILSTGAVGIGLTNPGSILEVQGTSTASTGQAFIAWDSGAKNIFQIANNGSTTLGNFGLCNGSNAVQTTAGGTFICGAITGTGGSSFGNAFNFVQATPNNYLIPTTTSTGVIVTASSTIGNGTQTEGLTVSGGATTTGTVKITAAGSNVAPSLQIGTDASGVGLDRGGANTLGIIGNSSTIIWNGTAFAPASDSTKDLGITTTGRWNNIFVNHVQAYATSTVGDGTQIGGLTISGGATTTLNAYFAGTVGIGTTSPFSTLGVNGFIDVGPTFGYRMDGQRIVYATSSRSSLFLGQNAGNAIISGNGAGGQRNTAVGFNSMTTNTTSSDITAIGSSAGQNSSGARTTIIGSAAGSIGAIGGDTILIGFDSGMNLTGSKNIFIGNQAASSTTSGNQNIVIGYDANVPAASSNALSLGNLLYGTGLTGESVNISPGKLGVGSTSPFARFSIHAQNNDTNTTLFAIGSTTSTGAQSTLLSVDNNGYVTINTKNPTGSASAFVVTSPDNSEFDFIDTTGQKLLFKAQDTKTRIVPCASATCNNDGTLFIDGDQNGTTLMAIIANGGVPLVGIGTTSPYAQLALGGGNLVIGAATAGGTIGDLFLPKLGTPAGSHLAVDPTGKVIATTTGSGSASLTGTTGQTAYFSGTNTAVGTSSLFISTDGQVTNKNGDVLTIPGSYVVSTSTATGNFTDVQSAINALPATGGEIFVRCGTYTLPTATYGMLVKVSNTVIRGAGVCTQSNFDRANTPNALGMNATGLSGIQISDMYFHQTNGTRTGSIGINASNTPLLIVQNVKIDGTATSVSLTDSVNTTFYDDFKNLDLRDNNNCVQLGNVTSNPINDNTFENVRCAQTAGNTGFALYLDSNGSVGTQNNTFINFDAEPTGAATGLTAIYADHAANNHFITPYVEGNATAWNFTTNSLNNLVQGGTFITNTTYTNKGKGNSFISVFPNTSTYNVLVSSTTIPSLSTNDAGSDMLFLYNNTNFAQTGNGIHSILLNGTDSGNNFFAENAGTGAGLRINSTGTGQAGTTTGKWFMHSLTVTTSGNAVCDNTTTNEIENAGASACVVSSAKAKHDIQTIAQSTAQEVMQLRPVQYVLNGGDEARYGFIAEEAAQVDPKIVEYAQTDTTVTGIDGNPVAIKKGDPLTFDYARYVGLLTAFVQDQQHQIDALQHYGVAAKRSAEENWQDILIALLILGFGWQQWQLRKLTKTRI